MALLVLTLLSVGFYMVSLDPAPFKFEVYGMHKSLGLTVLLLAVLRLMWKFTNPRVESLATHKPWEKTLAHIAHFLLYAALFIMPFSGWLMSSAGDFPVIFFGKFDVPDLMPKNEDAFEFLRDFHEIFAFVIIAVVGLHMAGAFKHHFIDRDETLQRMTSRRVGLIGGGILALAAAFFLIRPLIFFVDDDPVQQVSESADSSSAVEENSERTEDRFEDTADHAGITAWDIDEVASSIAFEATQNGQAFQGKFPDFDGDIYFDPANLAASLASIEIDIDKMETGSADRDVQARGVEWFDANRFPKAYFVTESFTAGTEANQYVAQGTLTIRDIKLPFGLPFTLVIDDSQGVRASKMDAEVTLNRLDFGIGQGQWKSTETIGNPVKLRIHIEAQTKD
jgi:cytochrome b561/polyisoprenoid-binding protein YceI